MTTPSDKSLAETNLSMKAFAFDKLALFDKMICNAKASFLISFPGFQTKRLASSHLMLGQASKKSGIQTKPGIEVCCIANGERQEPHP